MTRSARVLGAAAILASVLAAVEAGAILSFGSSQKGAEQPIAIEAEDGIEWQQQAQLYVARGNARAIQGDVSVRADTLTAHYRAAKGGDTEIWRIVAEGRVKIASATQWATGEKGVYDVDKGVLVLSGDNLRLETPNEKITARQTLEYWDARKLAVARGGAVARKDGRELRADVLTAHLRETKAGQLEVGRIEAFGNVEVATQSEVARAEYADYNVDSGIANLAGSVKLTRGTSQLNGAFAEVNMKTGVSRLLSQAKAPDGKRVRGLFRPKSAPPAANP